MSSNIVRAYRQRFRRGGISALRTKRWGGGTPRLKPKELRAVARRVKQRGDLSLGALGAWITAEFGVAYTPAGLKNMLKKQLGLSGV